jgi:hypothetical protein
MAFEAGPWEKKQKVDGAHVFSRKLLYGDEHDSAEHLPEGANGAGYGKVDHHHMHAFWRRNALKMMVEHTRRDSNAVIRKVPARSGPAVWPGDLGKHHALIEEMIQLGVVSLHQGDDAQVFAKIHKAPLMRVHEQYRVVAAAPETDPGGVAPAAESASPFVAAASFSGQMKGYVFKFDEQGLGYYQDTNGRGARDGLSAHELPGLPEGWVQGLSPEGHVYYWHTSTATSSWERPTGPPIVERTVALGAHSAPLQADGRAAVRKIEEESGATIVVWSTVATVRGTAAEAQRACQLLDRKISALAFVAQATRSASAHMHQGAHQSSTGEAKADWDFKGVAGFVAEAEKSREELRKLGQGGASGNALAALSQDYNSESDEHADAE